MIASIEKKIHIPNELANDKFIIKAITPTIIAAIPSPSIKMFQPQVPVLSAIFLKLSNATKEQFHLKNQSSITLLYI